MMGGKCETHAAYLYKEQCFSQTMVLESTEGSQAMGAHVASCTDLCTQ